MRCWVVYSSWAALTFPHRYLVNRIVSIFSSCLRRFGVSGHTLGCDAVFGLIVSDKTGGKARPAPRRRESNTWTVTDPKYNFIVLCALKTTTKVLTERQQNPRWAKNCVKAGRGGGGGDGEMITGWGAHKYSVFYSLLLLLHRCCLEPTLYSLQWLYYNENGDVLLFFSTSTWVSATKIRSTEEDRRRSTMHIVICK